MSPLHPTKCVRCMGNLVYNKFYSPREQFWGWQCVICGEIVDPVILENRDRIRAGQAIDVFRMA
ncbi:MAG: hypothetical protein EHM45_09280 [Desulfobacteraceae bacterium]|nr:MAG: hypothetical protein EHM45_09280 [Desulfobacteraceae bacterium]